MLAPDNVILCSENYYYDKFGLMRSSSSSSSPASPLSCVVTVVDPQDQHASGAVTCASSSAPVSEIDALTPLLPDHEYPAYKKYLVLLGCCLCNFSLGLIYTTSLFVLPVAQDLSMDRTTATLIFVSFPAGIVCVLCWLSANYCNW